jgi:SNF2 family DNA or RNA helicase
VTREGSTLLIKFSDKHHGYINAVKSIHGYRYDRQQNRWSVHIGHIMQVRDLAAQHGWIMSPAVRSIPELNPDEFPMLVSAEGEQLIIEGPYRKDVWHMLGEADGRQEVATGRWFIPNENATDVVLDLKRIARVQFVGDANDLTRRIDEAIRMLALSRQLEPSPDWSLTPNVKRELRAFQHAGVEYLAKSRRCFGWATMGAGKTTVALAAAEHLSWLGDDIYPMLVIPPSGLKTNWVREAKACIPHRTVTVCEGRKAIRLTDARSRIPNLPDIWICNYDILGDADNQSSWAHQLIELGVRTLIVDEGHRCINLKTIRTKGIVAISNSMPDDAPRYLLTGTPVRNKREEVHPQLAVIGRDGQFGTKKQLREDERLSRRLRTVCAWRPDPDEVLKSLGVLAADGTAMIIPQYTYVDGDPKVLAEYKKAEEDIFEFLREKAREKARELGQDPESAAVEAAMKAGSAAQMIMVNTLCRLAGQAKIHAAREWVTDFLDSGEKLLVFAENLDMLEALSTAVNPPIPRIYGEVKHGDRLALVDRFQEEEDIPTDQYLQALVLQIDAAGEGLTLTKAHQVLHAQLCWTPGQHDQADARAAWRMNDPHPVVSHYLVCADTIDEIRIDVLAAKRNEMAAVTDGDRAAIAAASTYGEVFARLLRRSLSKEETP